MVAELTDLNRNLMMSIDIVPVPTDEAVREAESRLLGVETNITNWQRRQNSNNCHTVREVHKLLRSAFNQAVKWELMTKNPCVNATLPQEEHKARDIWDAPTLFKALELCDDDIYSFALSRSAAQTSQSEP